MASNENRITRDEIELMQEIEFPKDKDTCLPGAARQPREPADPQNVILNELRGLRRQQEMNAAEVHKWQANLDESLSKQYAHQEQMLNSVLSRLEAQATMISNGTFTTAGHASASSSHVTPVESSARQGSLESEPDLGRITGSKGGLKKMITWGHIENQEYDGSCSDRPDNADRVSEAPEDHSLRGAADQREAPQEPQELKLRPSLKNKQSQNSECNASSLKRRSQYSEYNALSLDSMETEADESGNWPSRNTRQSVSWIVADIGTRQSQAQVSKSLTSAPVMVKKTAHQSCYSNDSDDLWEGIDISAFRGASFMSRLSHKTIDGLPPGRKTNHSEASKKFKAQFLEEWSVSKGDQKEYRRKTRYRALEKLVYSHCFELMVALVIGINTISIGAQTDWTARNVGEPQPTWWVGLEWCFAAFFLMELALRMFVERSFFFTGPNKKWNYFDFLVVLFSMVELVFASPELSQNRALRVLRVVRVLRIIRVMRFLHDLRKMISGIVSTLGSLFWAMVLLMMVMFLFGVLMTESVVQYRESSLPRKDPVLDDNYGSLSLTLYSLFKAISGGTDWGDLSDPLLVQSDSSWLFALFFAIYVAFAVFCVLNIVTAVFVDHANSICQDEAMKTHKKLALELRKVFLLADKDGDGIMNFIEFEAILGMPQVQHHLRRLDLDVESIGPKQLFDLLDLEDAGEIDVDTFTKGVMKLRGRAKSFDMYRLQGELSMMDDKLHRLVMFLEGNNNVSGVDKTPFANHTSMATPFHKVAAEHHAPNARAFSHDADNFDDFGDCDFGADGDFGARPATNFGGPSVKGAFGYGDEENGDTWANEFYTPTAPTDLPPKKAFAADRHCNGPPAPPNVPDDLPLAVEEVPTS